MTHATAKVADGDGVHPKSPEWPRHRPHPLAEAVETIRSGCLWRGGDVAAVEAGSVTITVGSRRYRLDIAEIVEGGVDAIEDPVCSDQYPVVRPMATFHGTSVYDER